LKPKATLHLNPIFESLDDQQPILLMIYPS
jgi:hypothetical protein